MEDGSLLRLPRGTLGCWLPKEDLVNFLIFWGGGFSFVSFFDSGGKCKMTDHASPADSKTMEIDFGSKRI